MNNWDKVRESRKFIDSFEIQHEGFRAYIDDDCELRIRTEDGTVYLSENKAESLYAVLSALFGGADE